MPEHKTKHRDSMLDFGKKILTGKPVHIDVPFDVVTVKSDLWGFKTYEDSHHNKLIPEWKGHRSQCVNGAHIGNTLAVINAIERGHADSDNNPTISTFLFDGDGPLAVACNNAARKPAKKR